MPRTSLIALAAFAFSAALSAQSTATATGRCGAEIVEPAQTVRGVDLQLQQGADVRGIVNVAPDGTVTVDGRRATAFQATAATAGIRSTPRQAFSILVPEQAELRSASGEKLVAARITSSLTMGSANRQGVRHFGVGASIDLSQGSRSGRFTGIVDLTVAYN